MVRWNFTNTAIFTSLNGAINNTTLSITLADASTWPSADFKLQLDDEVIDVESRTGNVLTVRTGGRGFDGTVAASHSDGVLAKTVVTAEDFLSRLLGYPSAEPGAPEDGQFLQWDNGTGAFVFAAGGGAAPEEYWREALLGGM